MQSNKLSMQFHLISLESYPLTKTSSEIQVLGQINRFIEFAILILKSTMIIK